MKEVDRISLRRKKPEVRLSYSRKQERKDGDRPCACP